MESDKRTARANFSISPDNMAFIQQCGHVKHSGEGRYNFSEAVDNMLTQMRTQHSPEYTALTLQREKEKLQEQIAELEIKASTLLGTTLDDFMSHMNGKMLDQAKNAAESAKNREQSKQDFLENLQKSIPSHFIHKNLKEHLKLMKDEIERHGFTITEAYESLMEVRSSAAEAANQKRQAIIDKVRPIIETNLNQDLNTVRHAIKEAGLMGDLQSVGMTVSGAVLEIKNGGGSKS